MFDSRNQNSIERNQSSNSKEAINKKITKLVHKHINLDLSNFESNSKSKIEVSELQRSLTFKSIVNKNKQDSTKKTVRCSQREPYVVKNNYMKHKVSSIKNYTHLKYETKKPL